MRDIKIPTSHGGLGKATGAELAPDKVMEQTNELFFSEDGCMPTFDRIGLRLLRIILSKQIIISIAKLWKL